MEYLLWGLTVVSFAEIARFLRSEPPAAAPAPVTAPAVAAACALFVRTFEPK